MTAQVKEAAGVLEACQHDTRQPGTQQTTNSVEAGRRWRRRLRGATGDCTLVLVLAVARWCMCCMYCTDKSGWTALAGSGHADAAEAFNQGQVRAARESRYGMRVDERMGMCKGGSTCRADPSRSKKRNLRSKQRQRVRQKHHLRWAEGEGWSPARRRMALKGTLLAAFSGRGAMCVLSGRRDARAAEAAECVECEEVL